MSLCSKIIWKTIRDICLLLRGYVDWRKSGTSSHVEIIFQRDQDVYDFLLCHYGSSVVRFSSLMTLFSSLYQERMSCFLHRPANMKSAILLILLPRISGCHQGCQKCFLPVINYPTLKLMLPTAAAANGAPHAFSPCETIPPIIYWCYCVCVWLLTHDLFATAKFLVYYNATSNVKRNRQIITTSTATFSLDNTLTSAINFTSDAVLCTSCFALSALSVEWDSFSLACSALCTHQTTGQWQSLWNADIQHCVQNKAPTPK